MSQKPKKPAPAPHPVDDIDLSAAMPIGPPPPPPKRGRGRPRTAPPPPPRKYKVRKDKGIPKKPKKPYIDNNNIISIGDSREYKDDRDLASDLAVASDIKGKMTVKELKFLSSYLSGGVTIIKAMDSAGYGHYSQDWRYKLAQKIVIKYESQADDHRKIFRAMGAGEVAVVEGLLQLAKGAKGEMVRLNAWSMIAKCIGLTKEQIESAGGITIIFEGDKSALPAALPVPGEPVAVTYQGQVVKPLQITK
jgi:hypothetical protein